MNHYILHVVSLGLDWDANVLQPLDTTLPNVVKIPEASLKIAIAGYFALVFTRVSYK